MCFKQTLNCTPPYPPNVKSKLNIGPDISHVNVWDDRGKKTVLPPSFKNMRVSAELSLRAVWISSNMCGLSLQTEHIMLLHESGGGDKVCPFQSMLLALPEHEEDDEVRSSNPETDSNKP